MVLELVSEVGDERGLEEELVAELEPEAGDLHRSKTSSMTQ